MTSTNEATTTIIEVIEARYALGARVYSWEVAKATGFSRTDVNKAFLRLVQPKFGSLERRNGWFHRPAA